MKNKHQEEITIKNNYGNVDIMFDGAEGGTFWFMQDDDASEPWVSIPFSEAKKVVDFMNKWINKNV